MEHKNTIRQVVLIPEMVDKDGVVQKAVVSNQHSLLPSVLIRRGNILNVVTEEEVSVGDTIQDWPLGDFEVVEILEQRKARGDWASTSYHTPPYFQQVKVK